MSFNITRPSEIKLSHLLHRQQGKMSLASEVTRDPLLCGKWPVSPWSVNFCLDPSAPPLHYGADGVATWGDEEDEWDAAVFDEEWARTGDVRANVRVKVRKLLDLPRLEAQRWRIGLLKQRVQDVHAESIATIAASAPLRGDWSDYTLCCRPYGDSFITSAPRGDEAVRDDLAETYYRTLLKLWYASKALTNANAALHLAMLRHLPLPVSPGKLAEVIVNGRSYWMVAHRPDEEEHGGSYRIWERLAWPEQDRLTIRV